MSLCEGRSYIDTYLRRIMKPCLCYCCIHLLGADPAASLSWALVNTLKGNDPCEIFFLIFFESQIFQKTASQLQSTEN